MGKERETLSAPRGAARLRREKRSHCEDYWHTLAVGIPIAIILFVLLPPIFGLLARMG